MAFYNGDAFNDSPAGAALAAADPNGVGIRIDATQVVAVAAFLRVINALENIRESIALLEASERNRGKRAREARARAVRETEDGIRVLEGGGLHQDAVAHLRAARRLAKRACASRAILELLRARGLVIETSES